MTNRELIMLLVNRDMGAKVVLEVNSEKEYNYSYGYAESVSMNNGKICISSEKDLYA